MRAYLLVCSQPSSPPHMVESSEKGSQLPHASSYKGTEPSGEGCTLLTQSLPKGPPPSTITTGIRFQQVNLDGRKHLVHSDMNSAKPERPIQANPTALA